VIEWVIEWVIEVGPQVSLGLQELTTTKHRLLGS